MQHNRTRCPEFWPSRTGSPDRKMHLIFTLEDLKRHQPRDKLFVPNLSIPSEQRSLELFLMILRKPKNIETQEIKTTYWIDHKTLKTVKKMYFFNRRTMPKSLELALWLVESIKLSPSHWKYLQDWYFNSYGFRDLTGCEISDRSKFIKEYIFFLFHIKYGPYYMAVLLCTDSFFVIFDTGHFHTVWTIL